MQNLGSRTVSALRLASAAACALAVGCSPGPSSIAYPEADLKPPDLLAAGPTSSREVVLRFDEAVTPVPGSFSSEPGAALAPGAEGQSLRVGFAQAQSAGADYSLVGEVDDLKGNRTRFLVRFTGWNDRAPPLRISEVCPCKNSSKTKPHRDFVELEALADGNLGGEELSWASSVKTERYRFPSAEVRRGDRVVLHLAPEGLPEERDETGPDLSASGGVDATPSGRDFWCGTMALPDASGVVALAARPGAPPSDGLFYADDGKSGGLGKGDLADLASSLAAAGAWPLSGASPAWEDGFPWGGATSRSICRSGAASGPSAWSISAAGGQSPGLPGGATAAESSSRSSLVPAAVRKAADDQSSVEAEESTEVRSDSKAKKPKAYKSTVAKKKRAGAKRKKKSEAEP